jgi:hypothetical protein
MAKADGHVREHRLTIPQPALPPQPTVQRPGKSEILTEAEKKARRDEMKTFSDEKRRALAKDKLKRLREVWALSWIGFQEPA